MSLLTREQILAAADIPTERLAVPEWGGDVLVRGMSGTERDAFEASIVATEGKKTRVKMENIRARMAAQCMVGEDGKRLFSPADVELLGKKSAAALNRVFEASQRLSGLADKDLEELEKNSGSAQNGASTSD